MGWIQSLLRRDIYSRMARLYRLGQPDTKRIARTARLWHVPAANCQQPRPQARIGEQVDRPLLLLSHELPEAQPSQGSGHADQTQSNTNGAVQWTHTPIIPSASGVPTPLQWSCHAMGKGVMTCPPQSMVAQKIF